jgi:hypothetical protein
MNYLTLIDSGLNTNTTAIVDSSLLNTRYGVCKLPQYNSTIQDIAKNINIYQTTINGCNSTVENIDLVNQVNANMNVEYNKWRTCIIQRIDAIIATKTNERNNIQNNPNVDKRALANCAFGTLALNNEGQSWCNKEFGSGYIFNSNQNTHCGGAYWRGYCTKTTQKIGEINAKQQEIDNLNRLKNTIPDVTKLQIPQFDVNTCINYVNTKLKLEESIKILENEKIKGDAELTTLKNNITSLTNDRNNTQKEFDAFKISKEQEKLDLVKQFQNDLTNLRTKNEKDQQDLIKEFEIAKQKSIDQITALFNKREEEYQTKIKDINNKITQLEADEKIRTEKMMKELEYQRADMERKLKEVYNERETYYKNEIDKINNDNKIVLDKLEIAKQQSIDQITALFNKREEEYQTKIKDINNKITQLEADGKIRTEKMMKELENQRADMERKLKEVYNERETYYKIMIDKINNDNKIVLDKLEIAKQKSIDQITALFNKREEEYQTKLKDINNKIIQLEADEKIRTNKMMKELENQRADMEKKLKEVYNERETYYKNEIDKINQDNQNTLNKLKNDQQNQINKLTDEYNIKIKSIEDQKNILNKQFDEFKKQTDLNIEELKKKYNDMTILYDNKIKELEKQITDKNAQIKKDLATLDEKFKQDVIKLSQENNLKTEKIMKDTNTKIEEYLNKYSDDKISIDKVFEEQKLLKKNEFDNILEKQRNDYNKRIEELNKTNTNIINELEFLNKKYKGTLEQNQINLDIIIKDNDNKIKKINEEYEKKRNKWKIIFLIL